MPHQQGGSAALPAHARQPATRSSATAASKDSGQHAKNVATGQTGPLPPASIGVRLLPKVESKAAPKPHDLRASLDRQGVAAGMRQLSTDVSTSAGGPGDAHTDRTSAALAATQSSGSVFDRRPGRSSRGVHHCAQRQLLHASAARDANVAHAATAQTASHRKSAASARGTAANLLDAAPPVLSAADLVSPRPAPSSATAQQSRHRQREQVDAEASEQQRSSAVLSPPPRAHRRSAGRAVDNEPDAAVANVDLHAAVKQRLQQRRNAPAVRTAPPLSRHSTPAHMRSPGGSSGSPADVAFGVTPPVVTHGNVGGGGGAGDGARAAAHSVSPARRGSGARMLVETLLRRGAGAASSSVDTASRDSVVTQTDATSGSTQRRQSASSHAATPPRRRPSRQAASPARSLWSDTLQHGNGTLPTPSHGSASRSGQRDESGSASAAGGGNVADGGINGGVQGRSVRSIAADFEQRCKSWLRW